MQAPYKNSFFNNVTERSLQSADRVIERLLPHLQVTSVLDVGCGLGAWLVTWKKHGLRDVFGIDGPKTPIEMLLIPSSEFLPFDLSKPINVGRKFDLVTSLEVAEHLPERSSDTLVDSLVRHADLIIFSAAIPGQGGHYHINEKNFAYWIRKFKNRGYRCFDCIRPLLLSNKEVERYYRYNMFLFVAESSPIPEFARPFEVHDVSRLMSCLPLGWRVRCWLLSKLPVRVINRLADLKGTLVSSRSRTRPQAEGQ
jgi:SAM-dependent methyltransferase